MCTLPEERESDAEKSPINFKVDLRLKEETGGDISSFISNGEWDLIGDFVKSEMQNNHRL